MKDKISKLLALAAKGSGASLDEATAAMNMAMALMAKHGISQDQLGGAEKPKARKGLRHTDGLAQFEIDCADAAGVLYGCTAIFSNGGKSGYYFIGRPDNIDAAELTVFWLIEQVHDLFKTCMPRGVSAAYRAQYRKTFKDGCGVRVRERAHDLVKNANQIAHDIGSSALVVQGYFEGLKKENQLIIKEAGMNLKTMKDRHTYGNGTQDGYKAGDLVKLRREVQA